MFGIVDARCNHEASLYVVSTIFHKNIKLLEMRSMLAFTLVGARYMV